VKRILLMDDSPIFLEVMRSALEKEGYAVVCASNLAELDGVRATNVSSDLVLMDVQMPEAFGDDIAMTLRHAYGVSAPIYLLSSLEETELAERAKWAEIDGFISKNRGMDAVITAVRGILEPRGAGHDQG
jgi:CheY-like chemotaxis protein